MSCQSLVHEPKVDEEVVELADEELDSLWEGSSFDSVGGSVLDVGFSSDLMGGSVLDVGFSSGLMGGSLLLLGSSSTLLAGSLFNASWLAEILEELLPRRGAANHRTSCSCAAAFHSLSLPVLRPWRRWR